MVHKVCETNKEDHLILDVFLKVKVVFWHIMSINIKGKLRRADMCALCHSTVGRILILLPN